MCGCGGPLPWSDLPTVASWYCFPSATAFNKYMEQQGVEPSMGAPPKGQMERMLETLLKVLDNTEDWGPLGEPEDEDLE